MFIEKVIPILKNYTFGTSLVGRIHLAMHKVTHYYHHKTPIYY